MLICVACSNGFFSFIMAVDERRSSPMLKENIKNLRKARGLSQEDLAVRMNVVRQTVSKWENGLSVPDADMLIRISEVFETPVSVLLGETLVMPENDDLKVISEKLETINLQLADIRTAKRKMYRRIFVSLSMIIVAIFIIIAVLQSPYIGWDYDNTETAVLGVLFHAFEWIFVRIAPIIFVGCVAGIIMNRQE